MPLSFFWAAPSRWRIKQCKYTNAITPTGVSTEAVSRVPGTVPPKAAYSRRAVTTRTRAAANNKSTTSQCDGPQVNKNAVFHSLNKSHAEAAPQAQPPASKQRPARSNAAKKATQQRSVVPTLHTGLHKQQTAAKPGTRQLPHGAAVLTACIKSASSIPELEALITQNHNRFNHIHVAAAFKVMFSLYQQTQQQQERICLVEVGRILLPLAGQHAAAFSTAQIAFIVYATAVLQLHPGAEWYHTLLQRLQDSVEAGYKEQQQQQHLQDSVEGAAAAAGAKLRHKDQEQQQQQQQQQYTHVSVAAPAPAVQQIPRLLHGKQLTALISNAGSPYELDAILHHTWPAVTGIHVTAAAQQLVRMHQQLNASQEQQQQLLQELCRKLLLHATKTAERGLRIEHALQQQQQQQQVQLSAWQVAVVLQAVTVLQVERLPQPHLLLQQLLQQASKTAAADVHAAALCNILSGAAWLMQQKVPQVAQKQQQQQHEKQDDVPPQQQQQHESQDALPPQQQQQQHDSQDALPPQQQQQHESQDALLPQQQQQQQQQHVLPSTSKPLTPDLQRHLLQQRRLLLLQQQQQIEQQQQQEQLARAIAKRCTLQHPPHQQQQLQRQQALQLLGDICTSCCQSGSLLQQQGMSLQQLSSVLAAFAKLQAVPQAAVLQQLLAAAGLGSSISSSSSSSTAGSSSSSNSGSDRSSSESSGVFSSSSIGGSSSGSRSTAGLIDSRTALRQPQQQQQQQLPRHAAGHAAAVLWQLGVLAELEQQQQQQRPAATLGPISSSRRSSQVLQALSRSRSSVAQLLQPVCGAAAATAAAEGGSRSSLKGAYVAVGALSKLASSLAEVQLPSAVTAAAAGITCGQGRPTVVMHAGSSLASTSTLATAAAAAAAVPVYSSNEHSLLQPSTPMPGLCSIGVQPHAVQQLFESLLAASQQQQQQPARQSCDPVKLLLEAANILQHLPDVQRQQAVQQQQQGVQQQQQQMMLQPPQFSSYATCWLVRYVTAVQTQLKPTRMTPATHAELLRMLARQKAYQLPVRCYKAVEQSVLITVEGLQYVRTVHANAKQQTVAEGVRLVHAWVQLLLIPRQLQLQAAVLKQYSSSSSSSSALPRVTTVYHVSESTVSRVCRGLIPELVHMDAETLGVAAWAVATLGPMEAALKQQWLLQLMHAVAAAAARGGGEMTLGPVINTSSISNGLVANLATSAASDSDGVDSCSLSTAVSAGSSSSSGNTSAAAAGVRVSFPPEALQRILQSFVLLRCKPPVAFLQQLLAVAAKDMALYKGSALVGLLLVLVQLRVRPGGGWLRGLMLRVQGRLRALSFEELTQLCWCLAQLGVVPPQTWMDEFADTAALHVTAWRKQQQQQQQQQAGSGTSMHNSGSSSSSSSSSGGGDSAVQNWQLYVMHWALIVCWRYRGSHAVGKLQYRLVRELNRVAWGVDRKLQKPLINGQSVPQQQQQQQQQQWQSERLDSKVQMRKGAGRRGGARYRGGKEAAEEAAAVRKLGRMRRQHYRLLRSGRLRKETPRQQQQQQQLQGARAANSTATARGGAAAVAVSKRKGKGRGGSAAAAAARQLALQLMRQRAAAVWPRQWDPICLARVAQDSEG